LDISNKNQTTIYLDFIEWFQTTFRSGIFNGHFLKVFESGKFKLSIKGLLEKSPIKIPDLNVV